MYFYCIQLNDSLLFPNSNMFLFRKIPTRGTTTLTPQLIINWKTRSWIASFSLTSKIRMVASRPNTDAKPTTRRRVMSWISPMACVSISKNWITKSQWHLPDVILALIKGLVKFPTRLPNATPGPGGSQYGVDRRRPAKKRLFVCFAQYILFCSKFMCVQIRVFSIVMQYLCATSSGIIWNKTYVAVLSASPSNISI